MIMPKPTYLPEKATTPATSEAERKKRAEEYAKSLREIAERFGVEMDNYDEPDVNPYEVPTAVGIEIAIKAGIITRSGKLKYPYD
ncbi:hypothetical protein ACLB1G_08565 [Oxalobacteraceae bacterium A2-2]